MNNSYKLICNCLYFILFIFLYDLEKETFANLFAIRHDKKAYAVAKEIIPNTVKEFEKRLEILEKL